MLMLSISRADDKRLESEAAHCLP
uniref:Uncharacterized protein n=1 Tax=Triticum urartu TaxID=4572 RepID=A0A8R7TBH4_TRIUA